MKLEVLMLIWTLVNPESVSSQSGLAVTQTSTIVSAATCEEVQRQVVTGAQPSGSVNSSQSARVYVTVKCIPLK